MLVIESKWQQSGESVDEKYTYLVLKKTRNL
ncbi:PD-(D/E)XK nuclease superfamily protein [Rickettsia conorii]|nr:PD-(D/E)XK nuclease superfamily protein [Rickettsia conorii]